MADLMILSPHPDDAELAMGGTIKALTKSGKDVVLVDLTDGEPTPYGSHDRRMAEAEVASKILGIETRLNLGLKNREIFDTVENRKLLAGVIRQYKPKLLFIPYWEDAHPDHLEAVKLAEAARFYAKFVVSDLPYDPFYPKKVFSFFSTHIRPRFNPSFVFDISQTLEAKIDSILAYKTQFVAHPGNINVIERVREEAKHWGFQIQASAGEPFICRENIAISSTDALLEL